MLKEREIRKKFQERLMKYMFPHYLTQKIDHSTQQPMLLYKTHKARIVIIQIIIQDSYLDLKTLAT